MSPAERRSSSRVLHAVVGCKLPVSFTNCVRSIRFLAPDDDLLIVDNNSQLPDLTRALSSIAQNDRVRLITRDRNELLNRKVGGLYDAYREIMAIAVEEEYEFVHLVQGDMQMLWWDDTVVARARDLFEKHPQCVELFTLAMPGFWRLGDDLEIAPVGQPLRIKHYGLCDIGLIHLGRWRDLGVQFRDVEIEHGREWLERGFRVVCHPWPTVAQIPWPAVVRDGHQRGSEVPLQQQFLLRPLDAREIDTVKTPGQSTWMEDICIPWGWQCLTPMWNTDLSRHYYWMYTYRDIRSRGPAALPRWERRGLLTTGRVPRSLRRPSLWRVLFQPLWDHARRLIRERA